MDFLKLTMSGLSIFALAACGGSTSESVTSDGSFRISNGIIADVEVPDAETLASLPAELRRVVNGFTARNETSTPVGTVPVGDATYGGEFGFEFDGNNDTLVTGNIFMAVNFQDSLATGSLNNITVYDADGAQIATNAGLLEIRGETPTDALVASAQGNFEVSGETYDVDARLAGNFGGVGAAFGLGQISGTVTNPNASTDGISGLYSIDKN